MNTKKDHSYGVVPVFKSENGLEFLLVHQISHRGDKFWVFPKGHPDGNENGEEAARRELKEETGITEIDVKTDKTFVVSYSFEHGGVTIDKTVTYYLGFVDDKATKITEPQEIIELKWCSNEEAKALLTHQNSKDVLVKVHNYFSNLG